MVAPILTSASDQPLWQAVHRFLSTRPRRGCVDSLVCLLGGPVPSYHVVLKEGDFHALSFIVHAYVASFGGPSLARLDCALEVHMRVEPFIVDSPAALMAAAASYAGAAVAARVDRDRTIAETCAAVQASFKAQARAEEEAKLASRSRKERQKASKRTARSRSGTAASGDPTSLPSLAPPPAKKGKPHHSPADARPAKRAAPAEPALAAAEGLSQRARRG